MKRLLLIGILIVGVGILGVSVAIPSFADATGYIADTSPNRELWEDMYEDCHGEGYHALEDEDVEHSNHWGYMSGHMGGSMMHKELHKSWEDNNVVYA